MCINMGINCLVTKHIRLVTATILLEILSMNHLIPNIEAAPPRIDQSLIQNKLRPSTLQDVVLHPVVVLLRCCPQLQQDLQFEWKHHHAPSSLHCPSPQSALLQLDSS
jgi:hypothetical protein